MIAPLSRCDRCNRPLIRDHDELTCFVCGTRVTPVRAHDRLLEERPPENKRYIAPNAGRPWSAADRAWVIANRHKLSSLQMARRLGRTEHAINQLLHKADLRKSRARNATNLVEARRHVRTIEKLEDAARPGIGKRLAARAGLSYWAAYKRLYRRGITLRDGDGMLSEREVARLYECTRDRVRTLMARGLLPHEKVGRMTRIAPEDAERAATYLRARSKYAPRRRPGAAP